MEENTHTPGHVPRSKVKGFVVIEADPRGMRQNKNTNGFSKAQPTTIKAGYPLRLLLPETAGCSTGCPWIYPLTYGGGLVSGDHVELDVSVRENCCALLTTQEYTKVYHCEDNQVTKQTLKFSIDQGGLLCVLQDPVVCYKDANYVQTQVVNMSCHGNIALLDWYLAGRVARNELWEFKRFVNRLDVFVDNELVLRENIDLADTPTISLNSAMGRYQVMAMFVLLGKKVEDISSDLYARFGQPQEFGSPYSSNCLVSATKLSYEVNNNTINGIFIKVMAYSTQQAAEQIKQMVEPLLPIIGGNPFQTKY